MVNPEFIRTFLTLVETRHFTRTAEKLNMTQPGVSQHIQKLEAHFEAELIRRTGKSFTLTEAGKKLSSYGERLFSSYDILKSTIREDDPKVGACRFASPGSFGLILFDALLACAKRYHDLQVSLVVAPNYSIPQMLIERKIDVGFMTLKPEEAELKSEKFSQQSLVLIYPKGLRLKSFADLNNLGFVNHPDGFHFASRLLQLNFPDQFISMERLKCRVYINQNNRILDPVTKGLGFAVLPETVLQNYARKDLLTTMKLPKKVTDVIYRVARRNEVLPSRYRTIEESLVLA